MEYSEVLSIIKGFGRCQKLFLFLITVPVMFDASTSVMLVFLLGPHDFRCRLPDVENDVYSNQPITLSNTSTISAYNSSECHLTINETDIPCTDWVYDSTYYTTTLISKFNMVCDEKFMRSHMLLSHFLGTFFNAFICGFLCDIWGRKPVLKLGIVLLIVPNFIRPWIPWVYLVMVCEFLNAMGSNLTYVVPFTLVTEIVDPSHRAFANFAIYFSYCMGSYLLLFYAYLIRDWEILIMVISGPIVLCFLIFLFVTESPRWLLLKGRTEEAMEIFEKTAKYNKTTVDFKVADIEIAEEKRISFLNGLKRTFKSRQLVFRFLILLFNWFAISMIYYGISMNTGELGGNIYVNYSLSVTVETIAVILCLFVEKLPRKTIYCPAMIVGGCACLCTLFTSLYGDDSVHWITVTLAMIGKMGVTVSFFVIYLITSEVFPTVVRASMIGLCSTGARIGSMSSSYIGKMGVLLDTRFGTALPLVIFGSVGTFAGLISLLLPETRNKLLPETFEDAINLKSVSDVLQSEEQDRMIPLEGLDTKSKDNNTSSQN